MTDLELMLMLEECGYEPSIENVEILREDEELLNELHPIRAIKQYNYDTDYVKDAKSALEAAKGTVKRIEGSYAEEYGTSKKMKKNDPHAYADLKVAKNNISTRKDEYKTAKKNRRGNTANALFSGRMTESYISDYELYQLLDESGYKPTEKNLYLLKEGLESGKYEIVEEELLDEGYWADRKEMKAAAKAAKFQVKANQFSTREETLRNKRENKAAVLQGKSDSKTNRALNRLARKDTKTEIPVAKLQAKVRKYDSRYNNVPNYDDDNNQ